MKKLFVIGAIGLAGSALTVAELSAQSGDEALYPEAWLTELADVAQDNPDDASTRLRLGVMLNEMGQHDEANKWLDQAYEIDPELAGDVLIGRKGASGVDAADDGARGSFPTSGPDVIVGSLPGVRYWGASGGIAAFSVATTSCNQGDKNLLWQASNNNHPVIGQNMYRWSPDNGGRMEQIGQSWLKHGFTALTGNLCASEFGFSCSGAGGSVLGVGCSDPYGSSLNGSYNWLGPKHEVNAETGFYPYPYTNFPNNSPIGKRLQVDENDLGNSGARYFVEGQYIARDDANAGNDDNNTSYREITFNSPPNWSSYSFEGGTARRLSAIEAWGQIDNEVTQVGRHEVPSGPSNDNGGHWILAYKVTDLGNGTWQYEYAMYNENSDRSGQAFTVPVSSNVNLSDIDFHDVDWHSGAPYSNADWSSSTGANNISWATQTFAQNQNANAIRWGTTYNFRFIADAPPAEADVTLDLFKPGSGSNTAPDISFPAMAPFVNCPSDLDGDGQVGSSDLGLLLGQWGSPYGASDLAALLGAWGPCS